MKNNLSIPGDNSLVKYKHPHLIHSLRDNLVKHLNERGERIAPATLDSMDLALLSIDELISRNLEREVIHKNKNGLMEFKKTQYETRLNQLFVLKDKLNKSLSFIDWDENVPAYIIVRERNRIVKEIDAVDKDILKLQDDIFLSTVNSKLQFGEMNSNGSYSENNLLISTLVKQVYDLLKPITAGAFSIKEVEQTIEQNISLNNLFGGDDD